MVLSVEYEAVGHLRTGWVTIYELSLSTLPVEIYIRKFLFYHVQFLARRYSAATKSSRKNLISDK
jgi:hypothetical protein